jgi:GNAT superfamily N-acetyltransferase
MSKTSAHILPRHDLSAADIDRLESQLYAHNHCAVGRDDGKGLEIKQLWVDKNHRGHGLGRRLLESAVTEARIRGCGAVWVLSYTFQAPGFYEKCGFRRMAELRDWPPGHAHIVLCRQLEDANFSTAP